MESTSTHFLSPRAPDATHTLPDHNTKVTTRLDNSASTATVSDELKGFTSGASASSSLSSELEFAHNADTSGGSASSAVGECGDASDVGELPVLVRDIEAVRLKTSESSTAFETDVHSSFPAPGGKLPTVVVVASSEVTQAEDVVEDVAATNGVHSPIGSPSSAGKTSTSPDSALDVTPEGNGRVEPDVVEVVCDLLDDVEDGDVIVVSSTDGNGATSPSKRTSPEAGALTRASLVPYRDREDDAYSSDSSSSSSSSDDVVVIVRNREPRCDSDLSEGEEAPTAKRPHGPARGGKPPQHRGVKVPGELDIDDLPPIEDLHITLPRTELRPAGRVRHAVDRQLVVESEPGQPVLDLESVLFRADGTALGRVFDVLGPVSSPYYTVRFNSADQLSGDGGPKPGEVVLYAPLHADVTQYVLESEVRKQRGSDASWENNIEPPPEHLDFSDDEQEREARKQLRSARCGGSGDHVEPQRAGPRGRGRGGPSRGGGRGRQQPAKVPGPSNGAASPRFEGPPRPGQFQVTRPQWPPSPGPQPHWQRNATNMRFRPNLPPPPPGPPPMFGISPNNMPHMWNTPPPPMAGSPWRPWCNRPPVFPNLGTPPPNFQPHVPLPFPCPPFPGIQQLHVPPPMAAAGSSQHSNGTVLPSPLPSPVYSSSGHPVSMYDPVPDLNRILTSPPPAPMQ